MTDKRITYCLPHLDSRCGVFCPSPEWMAKFETEEEALQALTDQGRIHPGRAAHYDVVTKDAIPADRRFRNAWKKDGPGQTVRLDMDAARAIQQDRINLARMARARELMEREFAGEDVSQEKAALQAIDAGQAIARAQTPDELDATWPGELPRPNTTRQP